MIATLLVASSVWADPVYQPSGANLTYGDVTHGHRVLSSSTNPAAAAGVGARLLRSKKHRVSVSADLAVGDDGTEFCFDVGEGF